MLSCYFQQINAAIIRKDPISLNHRIAAWLSSYFDILFAISRQFHPGEKRLLIYAEGLNNLPTNTLPDIQQLCAFSGRMEAPIAAHLERMLEQLDEKLAEFSWFPSNEGINLVRQQANFDLIAKESGRQ